MLVSVIIPTLNEEANLAVTLRQLTQRPNVELIVVDGGSVDRTIEVAQQFTPFVFLSERGRARQMNLGARHATGDILLFLHADSFLLPGAIAEIQRRMIGDGAVGGAFDLQIDSPSRWCKLIAKVSSHRSRLLRLPYGDQGIFVWRQMFEALGGFPHVPLMEDVGFARRLRAKGRLAFIRSGLVTSGRRWLANGVIKTTLVNWWVTLLYFLGVSPQRLERLYNKWLVSGRSRPDESSTEPSRSKNVRA